VAALTCKFRDNAGCLTNEFACAVILTARAAIAQVEAVSKVLENDLIRYSTKIGGAAFRRVVGVCLCVGLLTSLGLSYGLVVAHSSIRHADLFGAWPAAIAFRSVGQVFCRLRSLPELFAVLSHAPEISLLALVVALAGIPVSYFLSQNER